MGEEPTLADALPEEEPLPWGQLDEESEALLKRIRRKSFRKLLTVFCNAPVHKWGSFDAQEVLDYCITHKIVKNRNDARDFMLAVQFLHDWHGQRSDYALYVLKLR